MAKQEDLSPSPEKAGRRVNTAGWGRGGREGNGRKGLERQLGELKYADGEMCKCLRERKDPDPRERWRLWERTRGPTTRMWSVP